MTIHQGTAANPGFSSHIGFGKQQDCRGRKEAAGCFSDPGSDANQGPCCGLHWEEGPNSIPTNISLSIKLPGNSMGQDQAPLDLQPIMENHHHLSTRKRAKCATLMETRLRRPGGLKEMWSSACHAGQTGIILFLVNTSMPHCKCRCFS